MGDRARERFHREALNLAKLNHPAIVRVYRMLEFEGDACIVMELVRGRNLAQVIQEKGRLGVTEALAVARRVAEGLGNAHLAEILHRDLKTENVMLTSEKEVRILDFGLAMPLKDARLTLDDRIVGTPRAMSPEQTRNEDLDERSDLFSFGSLLYEVLTGKAPFLGKTLGETLENVRRLEPPPVRDLRPEVPERWSRLVGRLLEKRPEDRPKNAGEVARELAKVARELAEAPTRVLAPEPPAAEAKERGQAYGQPVTFLRCALTGAREGLRVELLDQLVCDYRDAFRAMACEVVESKCGNPQNVLGDGLMAYFGYPWERLRRSRPRSSCWRLRTKS